MYIWLHKDNLLSSLLSTFSSFSDSDWFSSASCDESSSSVSSSSLWNSFMSSHGLSSSIVCSFDFSTCTLCFVWKGFFSLFWKGFSSVFWKGFSSVFWKDFSSVFWLLLALFTPLSALDLCIFVFLFFLACFLAFFRGPWVNNYTIHLYENETEL